MERKRPPPVKVLSCQLRSAENQGAAGGGDSWLIRPGKGRTLPVSLVWMQGTVMRAQLDQNTVLLMDETGTFSVQGVNNIPKGKACLSQGKKSHTSWKHFIIYNQHIHWLHPYLYSYSTRLDYALPIHAKIFFGSVTFCPAGPGSPYPE